MPDMSFSTPILILPSVNAAWAPPAQRVAAAASARPILIVPPPSHAQVLVQLLLLPLDVLVRDHVDHPAVLDHVVAVGELGGEAEVLLDQQDGEALPLQLADRPPDLLHDH